MPSSVRCAAQRLSHGSAHHSTAQHSTLTAPQPHAALNSIRPSLMLWRKHQSVAVVAVAAAAAGWAHSRMRELVLPMTPLWPTSSTWPPSLTSLERPTNASGGAASHSRSSSLRHAAACSRARRGRSSSSSNRCGVAVNARRQCLACRQIADEPLRGKRAG